MLPTSASRRLGDLLDTLVAIRIDVGRDAQGCAPARALGPTEVQQIRVLVDSAIATTRDPFRLIGPLGELNAVRPILRYLPVSRRRSLFGGVVAKEQGFPTQRRPLTNC